MRAFRITRLLHASVGLVICLSVLEPARAQQPPVTAQVELPRRPPGKHSSSENLTDASKIAVWLVPLDSTAGAPQRPSGPEPRLIQRNKTFEPHLLVVQAGTIVQFPNEDPFFHNVFSIFDGKRFDLGLYEAGTTRSVHFDRPGVSFLFCNIHQEMSAVVLAVDGPYFNVSNQAGHIVIRDVPAGRYRLHVWYERSRPEDLKSLERTVTISASARDLGTIQVHENPDFSPEHKDKYGQDYVPPTPSTY